MLRATIIRPSPINLWTSIKLQWLLLDFIHICKDTTIAKMAPDPLVCMAWKTKPRRCNQHNHKKLLISIMHLCYKIYLNVPQKRENLSLKGSVDLIWHESVRYFCSDRYKLDCGVRTMASQPSRCNKFKKDSKVKLAPKT